ncbi:MAG: ABC transporter substrate-binding protein [Bacteroidales bacterium]|nr:ABC transporter substrate-binding protein [Bacteroidales bacterium]
MFLISCSPDKKEATQNNSLNIINNKYAELFKIQEEEGIKFLTIFDKSGNKKEEYVLIPKAQKIPDSLKQNNIIRTPVEVVVCLSTTHIAFLDILEQTNKIKAVSGSQYIYNGSVREGIESNKIKDVGYENLLDFETLLSLKPDMVTVYDINGSISPTINKLKKFNIPVVQINEYLESSLLGQAEWIKFFAEFFNKRELAKTRFNKISKSYNQMKNLTDTIKNTPTVLVNMPWKGTWYIPGGKSNIAQLVKDAGGNYLWSETKEKHNIPLNIEDVYLKANRADVWLNTGQANSINNVIETDKRLNEFKAIQTNSVYNRNKRLNKSGGNDYMESGTVRPDLILKDLIKILHPELLPEHNLFYYTKLQ